MGSREILVDPASPITESAQMNKQYLGDGVYVEYESGQFALTVENGITVTNTIFLEPEVADALIRYFKKVIDFPKD